MMWFQSFSVHVEGQDVSLKQGGVAVLLLNRKTLDVVGFGREAFSADFGIFLSYMLVNGVD